jgi:glycosyltransferase involved in cell wall biosynthesis
VSVVGGVQARTPTLVSVVVPARDSASTIEQQLAALAGQDYDGPWEVVVADNGSQDATAALARTWADRLPDLQVVDASGCPGASFARNAGVAAASGDFLAFCDADDVVTSGWLSALVAAARDHDMVGGALDLAALNDEDARAWIGWECPSDRLAPCQGFLLTVYGGTCGLWRSALDQVEGWNVEYRSHNDRELSWRVQRSSLRLGFAPGALVHYRMRSSLRVLLRKSYCDGEAQVRLYAAYRHAGAPRSDTRRALRAWAGFVVHAPELARSRARRGVYLRRLGEHAGRLAGSVRGRVLYL